MATENTNQDVFSALLGASFPVELTRDEEIVEVQCRQLPFTTLMSILGELATSTRDEIIKARRVVINDFVASGVDMANISSDQVNDVLLPLISSLIVEAPSVMTRFLVDVVINANHSVVSVFTPEDVLTIVTEVMKRLNTQKVAEKIRLVFSQTLEIFQQAIKEDEKSASVKSKKKIHKLPSQSESAQ